MSSHRGVVAAVLILGGLAIGWYFWKGPEQKTHSEIVVEAEFTRPTTVDKIAAKGFSVTVNGIDWLREVPELQCGDLVTIEATGPAAKQAGQTPRLQFLLIEPRLGNGPEDDFSWHQWGTDFKVFLSGKAEKEPVRVAAGKYRVRFYLQTVPMNFESGELPIVRYLGESKLVVTPSPDNPDCGVIPKEGPKTFRVPTE